MKTPTIVSKKRLIVMSLASVLLFLQAAPAQTETGAPCLVPAGSAQLDGVEGRLDHLAVDVQSQRLFVSGLALFGIILLAAIFAPWLASLSACSA